MLKKICYLFLYIFIIAIFSWAGGEQEAGGGAFGSYYSATGRIVPSEQMKVTSYVSQINYQYPVRKALEHFLYSGNSQYSLDGQEVLLQIGLGAARTDVNNLPPLNLAFVIDKSGSMRSENKMEWVKDSFDIFLENVRPIDVVSVTIHDNSIVETIFPATKMDSQKKKESASSALRAVEAGGAEQFLESLRSGYQEVEKFYNPEAINRVLFMTDGRSNIEGVYELAEEYRGKGIYVSSIGVGSNFDTDFVVELGKRSGGNSRFLGSKKQMELMFGDELGRLLVPVAQNIELYLQLPDYVELIETWGYDNEMTSRGIRYTVQALHDGDYETAVARIRIDPLPEAGDYSLGILNGTYVDVYGNRKVLYDLNLTAAMVEGPLAQSGFSDGRVLQAGTMMRFALKMQEIADIWYSENKDAELEYLLNEVILLKKELQNVHYRLDTNIFSNELKMVNDYLGIIGGTMGFAIEEITELQENNEIDMLSDVIPSDPLQELVTEIINSSYEYPGGNAAFYIDSGDLQNIAEALHSKLETAVQDESKGISAIVLGEIPENESLVDVEQALKYGRQLKTPYVLTGVVKRTGSSIMVFMRLLDTESERIITASQIFITEEWLNEFEE